MQGRARAASLGRSCSWLPAGCLAVPQPAPASRGGARARPCHLAPLPARRYASFEAAAEQLEAKLKAWQRAPPRKTDPRHSARMRQQGSVQGGSGQL